MLDEKDFSNSYTEISNVETSQEDKRKGKRKSAISISLILVATTVSILIALWGKVGEIFDLFIHADWRWMIAVFATMILMIGIRSLIIFCFARLYTRRYSYFKAVAADQVCIFYNAVTPSSTGGEVMEAYTISKQGIPISSSISMLAMYSILYQFVLIIFNILSITIKANTINTIGWITFVSINGVNVSIPLWLLIVFGFGINVSVIGGTFLMSFWKGFHNFIMGPVVNVLSKIKIVKNPDRTRENLRVQVENFKVEFRRLLSNIPFTLLIIFLFSCYFIVKFSIPFFISKALGNQSQVAYFWDAVFLSNFHQMITNLVPLPGAAGVSELFFAKLFICNNGEKLSALNSFFYVAGSETITAAKASTALCSSALLLWRSLTFFLPTFISGIFTAFYKASPSKDLRGEIPNRQTYVDLQSQTLAIRNAELDTILETGTLNRDMVLEKLKSYGEEENEKTGDFITKVLPKNEKREQKKKDRKRRAEELSYDRLDINSNDEDDIK